MTVILTIMDKNGEGKTRVIGKPSHLIAGAAFTANHIIKHVANATGRSMEATKSMYSFAFGSVWTKDTISK